MTRGFVVDDTDSGAAWAWEVHIEADGTGVFMRNGTWGELLLPEDPQPYYFDMLQGTVAVGPDGVAEQRPLRPDFLEYEIYLATLDLSGTKAYSYVPDKDFEFILGMDADHRAQMLSTMRLQCLNTLYVSDILEEELSSEFPRRADYQIAAMKALYSSLPESMRPVGIDLDEINRCAAEIGVEVSGADDQPLGIDVKDPAKVEALTAALDVRVADWLRETFADSDNLMNVASIDDGTTAIDRVPKWTTFGEVADALLSPRQSCDDLDSLATGDPANPYIRYKVCERLAEIENVPTDDLFSIWLAGRNVSSQMPGYDFLAVADEAIDMASPDEGKSLIYKWYSREFPKDWNEVSDMATFDDLLSALRSGNADFRDTLDIYHDPDGVVLNRVLDKLAKVEGVSREYLNNLWENDGEKSVGRWYQGEFPDDELGTAIDGELTFGELWESMRGGEDFYGTLGVGDSVIRERVFDELAMRVGVPRSEVYDVWVNEGEAVDDNAIGSPKPSAEEKGYSLEGMRQVAIDTVAALRGDPGDPGGGGPGGGGPGGAGEHDRAAELPEKDSSGKSYLPDKMLEMAFVMGDDGIVRVRSVVAGADSNSRGAAREQHRLAEIYREQQESDGYSLDSQCETANEAKEGAVRPLPLRGEPGRER